MKNRLWVFDFINQIIPGLPIQSQFFPIIRIPHFHNVTHIILPSYSCSSCPSFPFHFFFIVFQESFLCGLTSLSTIEELWRITHQKSIENQIKRRKWNWIGHTLRKETGAIEKTGLDWNPQGYRKRGRPKRTWRRTIEDEIRSTRRSWNEVKGIAGDRNAWKLFMDVLCSTRSKRI